ncbi:hypothetical protein [Gemella morbillorum]|jgi:hypothetical protein|uniref:hypothetical protein n=1 Tax=Gemella morbillorum TaxID=29391 RepID=UPI001CAFE422|nr:hypothetical protein [Gemella morbillorum]MBF1213051.1 hypothetical protein [Gemella morbillorum]
MERYEFVATTTNKEKMINVIIPVAMVGLLVGLVLVSYYFKLDNYIKPYSLFKSLTIVLIIGVCFLSARKLQELLSKKYVVELDGNNIRIWGNGKEVMSGTVIFCEIDYNKQKVGDKALQVDIYTHTDKIKFRARSKQFRTIEGEYTWNPLGTGEVSDIETLLSLGRKLKEVV